jgi:hypothetical protein
MSRLLGSTSSSLQHILQLKWLSGCSHVDGALGGNAVFLAPATTLIPRIIRGSDCLHVLAVYESRWVTMPKQE